MRPDVRHWKQSWKLPRKVWFTGSTAIIKGMGLCYDLAYGTAADHDESRGNFVAVPSTTYNYAFAGVAANGYNAVTGGQMIEIYEPGSICEVLAGVDTVINSTVLTCSASSADAGHFTRQGYLGRGSALALRTKTNLVTAAGSSWDGTMTALGTTITKTGMFAGCAVGDQVHIVGGGSDAAVAKSSGVFTIVTVTSDDVVVVDASVSVATTYCVGYVTSGNPTVLAYLYEGEESGLQEVVTPIDNAAAQSMVGGVTFIIGGWTITTANSTATLANGTKLREKKRFYCLGTLTTRDWVLTVTAGIQKDRATALATASFDAADEHVELTWYNSQWVCEWTAGATIA